MKHIIIGTAGHVDHGKSAIIKALTGVDTDRLKEEKLRGISIDLGFASLPLGDKVIAGIVDVPGHERFLKNMLAGTGGIDLAMLVVAADEGIMPQTKEHLAMLQLYGIRAGLIVINKIDKVDEEWLEMIESEIQAYVSDTFLKDAPCCKVSAATGEGLDALKTTLTALAEKVPARNSSAPFRLWIDRVFTIKGYGAVVTGSVLSGNIKVGDSVTLYPAETIVRVRGIEWHGEKVEKIAAGQRAAINLAGVETEELARGMVLSAVERGEISTVWDIAAEWQQEVESGLRIRLHLGTGEFIGRIYAFKDTGNQYMRLILEEPLAAGAGDRGIIRLYSPQYLLGGVSLIAPGRQSRKLSVSRAALADAITHDDEINALYYRLAESRHVLTQAEVRRQSGYLPDRAVDQAINTLTTAKRLYCLEKNYITTDMFAKLTNMATTMIGSFHKAQPDRSGLSKEIVRQKLGLNEKSFEILLNQWVTAGTLVSSGGDLALKEHADQHGDWRQTIVEKTEAALADIGLTNIDTALLAQKLALPLEKAKAAQDVLVKAGTLIKLGDFFVYSKTMQYIVQVIHKHFQGKQTLTVAELRDILKTSRKVALPVIEYLDMHKYTVRDGDVRRPTRKILDLSE
ncbi:selenocysteine-specific translation elongation factor [Sporomusa acidovorans]|uniref:Selenocysteine-specific elongation factor n=1 Tax=Sporomusa acidovorans (strain ATCC 49682 / DSM 3132 / Mol) TaxID=1123286 RepID=A0ABZ3JC98_SPOA4|nr:selenocysteine-specific translation elongation factor [Sporomusa acidovorans]OZC22676.1 selenocysteine-specific elongation factor [Sporomusa acidovorans DSM 3132]SDE77796.1 selenocysteine-specific translation elongation factor SelB [Sporomusa acidovorans]